eukprot:TRINITY_DN42614_c0_g1_i1.p1 TRINITY_DN42614_c0_g1~~TRINITY_DN42614_c0_g1_i1.p1  ORF type:complete len:185 (-),score=56.21 TRINITY_DN42614_c0_g1_i1:12-566(-)
MKRFRQKQTKEEASRRQPWQFPPFRQTMMGRAECEKHTTREQVDVYMEAFKMFDQNNDGTITIEELGEVMHSLGRNPTKTELKDMVNEVDMDSNGSIDFTEFLAMMGADMKDEEMREAFKMFDLDGDGLIDANEIKQGMKIMGEEVTDEEVLEIMKDLDVDGDGFVNYTEFHNMMILDFGNKTV